MSTAAFSFPLNVYARLLERNEGRVDFLHFGVFSDGDDNVLRAQERADALMWQALPPPCRVLEVGIGLGTTLAQLTKQGYEATGITPEAAQIAEVRRRHGDTVRTKCTRLEDFDGDEACWEAMLLQESAQYIEPLALFAAAERLLRPDGGCLVVMDEFALTRSPTDKHRLPHLTHFLALAERLGWKLTRQLSLGDRVLPTVSYLLQSLDRCAGELARDLSLPTSELDALARALYEHRTAYEERRIGYALLRFERCARPSSQLVPVTSERSNAMRELFGRVFKHEMTDAHWHWKYGDGRGQAIGSMRGGRMVAHAGSVSRDILLRGEPARASQVCDVMVESGAHTALARRGPFHAVAATLIEQQIGWGMPHLVGFGFPNRRAFSVAKRLDLYVAVDEVLCLRWTLRSPEAGAQHGGIAESPSRHAVARLQTNDLIGAEHLALLERAWREMANALRESIVAVRDPAWIGRRYLEHPVARYELALIGSAQTEPVGVVITRQYADRLEIVDLVADPLNFALLFGVALERARELGVPRVECWTTRSHLSLFDHIETASLEHVTLDVVVPANAHTPGPVNELVGRWFLMAGDADFT